MRLKTELYPKEQDELIEKIIKIIGLDEDNMVSLHELDNNKEKQQNIMDLSTDLKKYFSYAKVRGLTNASINRAWLSIIKQITKSKYKIHTINETIEEDGAKKHTVRYLFVKLKHT